MKNLYFLLIGIGLATFSCTEHPYATDGHNEVQVPDGLFDSQDSTEVEEELHQVDAEEQE